MRFFLALSLLASVAAEVLQLNEVNFGEKSAGKSIFIKFFAPWCGHCKQLAPIWEQLAEEWEGHQFGLVAEVDCTSDDAQQLCTDFEITGYPTLLYGDPLSPERYEGPRDYESLSKFAKDNISKPICSVFNIVHCDAKQKAKIEELKKKSQSELEKMEEKIELELDQAQEKYDAGVEKLNEEFEKLVSEYNAKIDEIRETTDYKMIQQVLQTMYSEDDGGEKDEL